MYYLNLYKISFSKKKKLNKTIINLYNTFIQITNIYTKINNLTKTTKNLIRLYFIPRLYLQTHIQNKNYTTTHINHKTKTQNNKITILKSQNQ